MRYYETLNGVCLGPRSTLKGSHRDDSWISQQLMHVYAESLQVFAEVGHERESVLLPSPKVDALISGPVPAQNLSSRSQRPSPGTIRNVLPVVVMSSIE